MAQKLFVGNLSFNVDESELKEVFGAYGTIKEVVIVKDRETGRSRGFAFVTFDNAEDANAAMGELNRSKLDGRIIGVELAKEKSPAGNGERRRDRDERRR